MINSKAQKFCRDDISKIENYDKAVADSAQSWDVHHRLELTLDGEFAHTATELKRLGMYYNRPYFELIFLTHSEHQRLHNMGKNNRFYGKNHSDEHRKKIAETMKGRTFTDEHKRKIAEAMKGKNHSNDTRKKMSESAKARWVRSNLNTNN